MFVKKKGFVKIILVKLLQEFISKSKKKKHSYHVKNIILDIVQCYILLACYIHENGKIVKPCGYKILLFVKTYVVCNKTGRGFNTTTLLHLVQRLNSWFLNSMKTRKDLMTNYDPKPPWGHKSRIDYAGELHIKDI